MGCTYMEHACVHVHAILAPPITKCWSPPCLSRQCKYKASKCSEFNLHHTKDKEIFWLKMNRVYSGSTSGICIDWTAGLCTKNCVSGA